MAATWQQRGGGSNGAAHGGNGAAHHWWNAGGIGTADSPPASQPRDGWYDAGGEPAWHRRQRSQRTHDRTLMRVAHASERVQQHHSSGANANGNGGAYANGNGGTCRWCEAAVSAGQRLCVSCVQKALREDELGGPPTPEAAETPCDPHSIEQQQAAIRVAMGTLGKAGVPMATFGQLRERAAELQEQWDQSRPAELRRQSILVDIAQKKEKLAFAVKEESKQRKVLKETRTRMDKLRDDIDDLHEKEGRLAREVAGESHSMSDKMRDIGSATPHDARDGNGGASGDLMESDDVLQIKLQVNELMGKVGQMAEVVRLLVNTQMAAPQHPQAAAATTPTGISPTAPMTPSPGRTPMGIPPTPLVAAAPEDDEEQQLAAQDVEILDTDDNCSRRRAKTRGRPRTRAPGPFRSSGRKDRRSDPMKFAEKEQKEASQQ